MRLLSITVVVLALAELAGMAAGQEKPQADTLGAVTETAKPEAVSPVRPMAVRTSVDNKSYTLGPADVIHVRVWREPDLSGVMEIRPDGQITMPVIKELKAGGLTPAQLEEQISKALSEYVKNPQVTVSVEAVRSKRYYLSGEINRPGAYPLASATTAFEALTLAGGFREFANKKNITIIRGTQRFRFNWNEVVKGKNLAQNIALENGDQIVVP
jgi:polysaccharide export outer membrane protein